MLTQARSQTLQLSDWLERISRQHPAEISLGLDRCKTVFNRLFPGNWYIPILIVAGTNGKGSTVAYADALARAANLDVLTFTSPHLIDYRERLCLNNQWLEEEQHIEAFQAIENVAADIPLTYFEFSALSAFFWAFKLKPDLLILEVGLGGRLDATNLIPADVAVITTVDLDHQDYLGDTLEAIASEKLGVIHESTTAIIADQTIPVPCIKSIQAKQLIRAGVDYEIKDKALVIDSKTTISLNDVIKPATNSAAAIMAIHKLFPSMISKALVQKANELLSLTGRQQVINTVPLVVVDVAHNPQAMKHLMSCKDKWNKGDVYAVIGMLADKNIKACLELMCDHIDHWVLCSLDTPRAYPVELLEKDLLSLGISIDAVTCYPSVQEAYAHALAEADNKEDTVLVTGSFYTVGPTLEIEVLKQEKLQ